MDLSDSDHDLRSLPASPRRRALARASGSVPRSPDVAATLVLMLLTFGLVLIGPSLLTAGQELIAERLTHLHTRSGTPELFELSGALLKLCRMAAIWLLLAAGVAVIGNVIQFGLLFAPQVIQPELERLSPGRGLQRIFSQFQPRALLLHGARLVTIAVIAGWIVWSVWPDLSRPEPGVNGEALADAVIILGSSLAGGAAIVSLLMALAERMRHEARLRRTPREARDERRLSEADPDVLQQQRETRRQFVTSISRSAGERDT